jgi:hypothetical protein
MCSFDARSRRRIQAALHCEEESPLAFTSRLFDLQDSVGRSKVRVPLEVHLNGTVQNSHLSSLIERCDTNKLRADPPSDKLLLETGMDSFLATPLDQKYIGLATLLYSLRQDLDVYCLISVNARAINEIGTGQAFFGHIQRLSIEAISLNFCKIFEDERGYELNSIQGVMNQLPKIEQKPTVLDASNLKTFITRYDGQITNDTVFSLEATVDKFRTKHKNDLERFKTFRDKVVAHSEHGVTIEDLPSYAGWRNYSTSARASIPS